MISDKDFIEDAVTGYLGSTSVILHKCGNVSHWGTSSKDRVLTVKDVRGERILMILAVMGDF